jgi:anti-anti-sigma regulatory factor
MRKSRLLVREVLIPAQQINQLDSIGADQLARLQTELEAKGITFSFAEIKSSFQKEMRQTGIEESTGTNNFFESIEDDVQEFLRCHK